MAENSGKTAKTKRGKPFEKDDPRINRGGRPKGFASRIRELTMDGDELAEYALEVLRGTAEVEKVTMLGEPYKAKPGFKDRQAALEWLGDRGWGKPTQSVEMSGADGGPLVVQVVSYADEADD